MNILEEENRKYLVACDEADRLAGVISALGPGATAEQIRSAFEANRQTDSPELIYEIFRGETDQL